MNLYSALSLCNLLNAFINTLIVGVQVGL